jgi:hypothetical protein
MVEETAEVREWNKPLGNWNLGCCGEFVSWIASYVEQDPTVTVEEALKSFRMVMDTGYGDDVIYKGKDRYTTGWTDSRGVFGR